MGYTYKQNTGHADEFVPNTKEEDAVKNTESSEPGLLQAIFRQLEFVQQQISSTTKLKHLKKPVFRAIKEIGKLLEEYQKEIKIKLKLTQHKIDEMASRIIVMEFESIQLTTRLKLAKNRALIDPVTCLPNRLAYKDRLMTEIARWKRYQTPLTLILWDIDRFKRINDTYGHQSGDKTLELIARLLLNQCRKTDFVSRYGGEEFIMLLPDTSGEAALHLAEQIRLKIENTGFNSKGQAVSITISCGISEFTENDTGEAVFERADNALYRAKHGGRNRCILD